ncbi:MAG TPA: MoaD/ThiS family protein [Firmicutes bacterium]|nr:MoaD/ThiS family protein [Bacillota bacterium]
MKPVVVVQLFATLREAAGTSRIEVEADTVREVLASLIQLRGEPLRARLFGPAGDLLDMLAVLVNGRNIRFLGGLDTVLKAGDTVSIIPPVAGGRPFVG